MSIDKSKIFDLMLENKNKDQREGYQSGYIAAIYDVIDLIEKMKEDFIALRNEIERNGEVIKTIEGGQIFFYNGGYYFVTGVFIVETSTIYTATGKFRIWNEGAHSLFGIYIDYADIPGLADFLKLNFERSKKIK